MKNKIKIIDLLNKIANRKEVPKVITYENKVYHYVEEYKDYVYDDAYCLISDYFVNHYGITMYLNDEVEILDDEEDNPKTLKFGDEVVLTRTNCDDIQGFIISSKGIEPIEDKDIPLIPDDELVIFDKPGLDFNFKVLKEKINQVAEEFNEYRKENE